MKLRAFFKEKKGYSLIELIVVIAILAACGGLITANIALVPRNEAKKCAQSIDAALSECKIEAMTKAGGMSLKLYADADGNIHLAYLSGDGSTVVSDDRIANSRATVTVDSSALSQTGSIWSFERNSGSVKNATGDSAIVVSGGGRSWTIKLYQLTGAHEMTVS